MKINQVEINYVRYGNKNKQTVVLLHGWGQNIEMMKPIGDNLDNDVIIIDLPGFGESSEPTYPWSLDDYVESVRKIVLKEKIKNPIVMGHSFGGKIAILYASKYDTKKLLYRLLLW